MKNYLSFIPSAAAVLLAAGVTGCVDDSYDLDNINTDIEVKIKDLTVPIKLDAITLSNVFDLEDDSVIKEGTDGNYSVVLDGDFKSDPIRIAEVSIDPGAVESITTPIVKYDGTGVELPPVNIGETAMAYEVTEANTTFSFTSSVIDKSIRSIDKIKGNWSITLTLDLSDMNDLFNSLEFRDLILSLPAGFHTTSYPCTAGNVSVGNLSVSAGSSTVVVLDIDEIDLTKFNSTQYTFTPATGDTNNGKIHFEGELGVKSGFLVGKTNATVSSQPQQVVLNIYPILSNISVTSVSGTIGFALDNFSVEDATLTDLPDFLNDDNTKITLSNPQLYFSLNNPVATDNLNAVTGLTLTSYKNATKVNTCTLDAGEEVVLGTDKGNAGPYNFCLAPSIPAEFYPGYAGSQFVRFTSLSRLLEGDGLPSVIAVNFDNPRV
ncbi:MAG: hypothetical protein K2G40_04685, partial [Muribaculaceae bacterium]|nr:hypothetical protein [Muribaculaceae bacterium]